MEQNNDQIDTNLYSRQIGTFGIETMGKLIKMNVVIIGLRGNGAEIAKNLILAGPKSVQIFDPEVTALRDLGSNFYLEEKHVGKVSRSEGCLGKLQELNQYVKVDVIKTRDDLNSLIKSGNVHVVCQTEMLLDGEVYDPKEVNEMCRASKVGHISTQVFGPWGYAFVDYGEEHTVTDHDGEQPKSFIVVMIEKGQKTKITMHEDKKHIYQYGDYVILKEIEGMNQINNTTPIKVIDTTPTTVTLELDSTGFSDYTRQGLIENVKVPTKISFHDWDTSYKNPNASSPEGFLMTPDLSKFGRSPELHACLYAIREYVLANKRYPTAADIAECSKIASEKTKEYPIGEVEIDAKVLERAVSYAACNVSPMCAFFGGMVAQEIVKYTGKYSPLRQWLHFDIFDTLPREGEPNREPMNSRYDD
jgi:ubiquitin-activating enzyme E1